MKKYIFFLLLIFFSSFVYAGWCDDDVCYQHDLNVFNISEEWVVTKYTGVESENFYFWTANAKDKKTELGWIMKPNVSVLTPDEYLYDKDGNRIKDNKNKDIKLKYETSKCGGLDCYHITLTDAAAVNINDSVALGSSTIVSEYQDINLINYHSDWFDVNVTLLKWINDEWMTTPDDIFVFTDNVTYKFGANDTANENISSYKYIIDSSIQIRYDKGFKYHLSKFTKNNEERHYFDFTDICNRNFTTDCVFNLTNTNITNKLEVIFLSDKFIDPTITIENVSSYGAILNNVTEESPPILHETINDSSLVLYMPFDVPSKTITYDYSYNDNDGTVTNALWTNNGKFGGGFDFDGSGDYITTNLADNYSEMAVSAWVKLNGINDGGVVGKWNTGSSRSYLLYYDAPIFYFCVSSNGLSNLNDCGSYTYSTTNEWIHLTGVWNGTKTKLYVNGSHKSTSFNNVQSMFGSATTAMIGWVGGVSWSLNGTIDEVMIFNRGLSATEISQIYNLTYSRFYQPSTATIVGNESYAFNSVNVTFNSTQPNSSMVKVSASLFNGTYEDAVDGTIDGDIVGWWHFDNRSGYENDTKVFDWSGNNNNGTANGNAQPTTSGKFGGGFEFDGDSDYIEVPHNNNFNSIDSLTYLLWIKLDGDTGGWQVPISKHNGGASAGVSIFVRQGSLNYEVRINSTNYDSGYDMILNQWQHIGITLNGDNLTFYVNGEDYKSQTAIRGGSNTNTLRIGTSAWAAATNSVNGTMDEVMIFNRSLSASEVKNLYNGQYLKFHTETAEREIDEGYNTVQLNFTQNVTGRPIIHINMTNEYYTPSVFGDIIIDIGNVTLEEEAPTDSCNTTIVGDHTYLCSDDCSIGTVDCNGYDITISGAGSFKGNLTNYGSLEVTGGCLAWASYG